jgi:hypothetical protein
VVDPVRQVLIAGAALVVAAVVASPVVATTSATRPPTQKERVILVDLVRAYVESTCCEGIKRIKIDNVLVSVTDARWAEVNMQAWDKTLAYLGAQTAVLHKGVATGRWALLYLDLKASFCKPPPKVRRDLGLVCPHR